MTPAQIKKQKHIATTISELKEEQEIELNDDQLKNFLRLSLKAVKNKIGHEGEDCLSADVYFDKLKIGHAHESFNMGGTHFDFDNGLTALDDVFEKGGMNDVLGLFGLDNESEISDFKKSIYHIVDVLVAIENEKRELAKIERQAKKSVLFGSSLYYVKTSWKGRKLSEMSAKTIEATMVDLIKTKGQGGGQFLHTAEQFVELGLGHLLGTHPAYPKKVA